MSSKEGPKYKKYDSRKIKNAHCRKSLKVIWFHSNVFIISLFHLFSIKFHVTIYTKLSIFVIVHFRFVLTITMYQMYNTTISGTNLKEF